MKTKNIVWSWKLLWDFSRHPLMKMGLLDEGISILFSAISALWVSLSTPGNERQLRILERTALNQLKAVAQGGNVCSFCIPVQNHLESWYSVKVGPLPFWVWLLNESKFPLDCRSGWRAPSKGFLPTPLFKKASPIYITTLAFRGFLSKIKRSVRVLEGMWRAGWHLQPARANNFPTYPYSRVSAFSAGWKQIQETPMSLGLIGPQPRIHLANKYKVFLSAHR